MFRIKVMIFLILPFIGLSQVEIKGKITHKSEPIPFANVFLTVPESETIAAGTITNEDGSFVLQVEEGRYNLTVSFLGFNEWTKEIQVNGQMIIEDIELEEEDNRLDEVVLVSKKKIIERKVDRLVFNVENSISASGGDAVDALRVAPGIRVQNDEITMIGKSGMRILVDGRLMQLTGDELTNFLSTISADDIKSIEIITNPPAKYEAEGNSGLINIIFKKGSRNSWNNAISLTYNQAPYDYYALRNNFTYNKDKVKLLVNLNSRLGDYQEIEEMDVFYPDGIWKTELKRVIQQKYFSGRLEFDYELGERSIIGIQYIGTILEPDIRDKSNTEIFNTSNTIDSLLVTNGFTDDNTSNHSLNLHYNTELDTLGRKISVDLDYFNYDSSQDRDFVTNSATSTNQFLNTITAQNNIIDQDFINYSARIDVEHPFNFANISYGAKYSFINNENAPKYFEIINGTPVMDTNLSDEFEYEEETSAIYINASKDLSEKWKVQLGLRYENTDTEGISKTLNQVNKNSYAKLFPTFYLSYAMNDNNAFSFSYGKRINRPSYAFLNPFRFYTNSNIYSEGNPFLQPSFTDNLEFTHIYKNKLTTNLYASITTDGFGPVSSVNEATNEQIITRENFYNLYNYGLTETFTFSPFTWWDSQNTGNLGYSYTDFYNSNVDAEEQNGFGFYIATYNTFLLNKAKTLTGQINYWYSGPSKTLLYQNSDAFNVDLVLKYNMLDNNLQATMGMYDVFNTSPVKNTYFINNVRQTYQMFPSNQYFRLSLLYKFGNKKINAQNRSTGNEEERRRAGL